jgi:polyisoprenoid-binding protein YceI
MTTPMRTKTATRAAAAAVLTALSLTSDVAATPRTFMVEPDRSRALIDVGKTGAFSFAGHTHEVEAPITSGVINLDSDDPSHGDVRLEFNAAAMHLTGKGEPADDVPKVTAAMLGEMVLDVKRYPGITFESTRVSGKPSGTGFDLSVTGRLTIRGTTQTVTAPVAVQIAADRLTATGKFVIKQTDYGIMPISVGGVVKVKNELTISFTVTARER